MKIRSLVAALAVTGLVLSPAALATATTHSVEDAGLGGGDVNQAVAVNTEDGASLFRLAFSVKRVADGVVDQENAAVALASCTDCRTVALAFQVVLVMGGADVVVPVNQAVAYNDQCAECMTFASATQIVVGVGGPVRLTGAGITQLLALQRQLRDLEGRLEQLTAAELIAEVSAIEAALITILDTELVAVGPRGEDPGAAATTGPPTTASITTTTATSDNGTVSTTSSGSTTTTNDVMTESSPTTDDPDDATGTTVTASSSPADGPVSSTTGATDTTRPPESTSPTTSPTATTSPPSTSASPSSTSEG